jgi:DNA-binding NtrC family response regulator
MARTLISWIGDADIAATDGDNPGPIADFMTVEPVAKALLLQNRQDESEDYCRWLGDRFPGVAIELVGVGLDRPHDFDLVYDRARDAVLRALSKAGDEEMADLAYLLSSGTKAMSSALLLIGCIDMAGSIHFNWVDRADPPSDPANRCMRIRWTDRFSLALFASRPPVGPQQDALLAADGTELSVDPKVRDVYARARRVARTSLPVLVLGETGTGKEMLARHIHDRSDRKSKPFIPVNCGAFPEALIESILFGHRRGAFTGADSDRKGVLAEADGGTVFLDEVGDLPQPAQVKLLRFLQEGEVTRVGDSAPIKVDTRIVAATHRDLRTMVHEDRFRADLYFRLTGYPLMLPPLRERRKDLQLITDQLIANDGKARGESTMIDDAAMRALARYEWPGNVRELQNVIRRCCIDARTHGGRRFIGAKEVSAVLREQGLATAPRRPAGATAAGEGIAEVARQLIDMARRDGATFRQLVVSLKVAAAGEATLQEGSQKAAAALLGFTEQWMSKTLKA